MKKLKKRRRKLHTRKVFLLNSILVVFLFLGIGYSLLSTELTIDGSTKVKEYLEPTLYNVLKKEAISGGLAKEYTGSHQDSMDASLSTEKIYHWYANNDTEGNAILDKNNVIFANHCWQMIRTTDTGGVKMIYNGEPENNQCLSTRGTHVGYGSWNYQTMSANYWYGTDYIYDSTNKTFKVSGTTEQVTWNATTGPGLIGKYTCKKEAETDTCTTLYLIESYNDVSKANTISINSNSNYSQFGKLSFAQKSNSLTYVGYKYGDIYEINEIDNTNYIFYSQYVNGINSTSSLSPNYYYSRTISFNGSSFTLDNPVLGSTIENSDYSGYYTLSSSSAQAQGNPYYIISKSNSSYRYVPITPSKQLNDYSFMIGDSLTDNGDNTYTLNNAVSVSIDDWYINYADYNNFYTCGDSSTITCQNPWFLTTTSTITFRYLDAGEKIVLGKGRDHLELTNTILVRRDEWYKTYNVQSGYIYTCNTASSSCTEENLVIITKIDKDNYEYVPNRYWGSSVSWNGTNYTLQDPIEIENYNKVNNLSTHHFMCLETGHKTCEKVAFIYLYNSYRMNYIVLENGIQTIENALDDMLTKNSQDSIIKKGIDEWYKRYILDYDEYIEDTIFCNNRSYTNDSGWNPEGNLTSDIKFYSALDLKCLNNTDRFSISNSNAKLTYKVALMTSVEMALLNNNNSRKTGYDYWLLSAAGLQFVSRIRNTGEATGQNVTNNYGVRPAISLKPKTKYTSGDGSMANPYIVETG